MHIRFSVTLALIVLLAACASAPRLPDMPESVGSTYRGPGAVHVKHEALAPEEHEASQPLTVRISRVNGAQTESGVELVLRPGESEVIRLLPGQYDYVVTANSKRTLRGSFELAPPMRLLFDLTLSLRRPVRQAYLTYAEQMKQEHTLPHPTTIMTIMSDTRRTVEVTARTPKGHRFRAPVPMPPCPPKESSEIAVVAPEGSVEDLGMNLLGSVFGSNPPTAAVSPASAERGAASCFDKGRDSEWLGWMDRHSVSDVTGSTLPDAPLAVEGDFSVSLSTPANLVLPAGQWILSGDGKEVQVDIEATTRIVIIEWDLSPPEVHLIPSEQ